MDKSKQYISIPIEQYDALLSDYNTLKDSLEDEKCIVLYDNEYIGMGFVRKGYSFFSKDETVKALSSELKRCYSDIQGLRASNYTLAHEISQNKIKQLDKKWWVLW